jgi:hypothetical protein
MNVKKDGHCFSCNKRIYEFNEASINEKEMTGTFLKS